jgi:hypothetical protein
MRKFTFGLATVVVAGALAAGAIAGPIASSPNGEFQTLDVDVYPGKGKAAKAHAVGLQFSVLYGKSDGSRPRNTGLFIRFDKSLVFNLAGLPMCDATALETTGPSACPDGSQLGTGTASADLRPSGPASVPAEVTLYRGSPDATSNGDPLLLIYAVPEGSTTGLVLFFVFRDDPQGPYRFALDGGPPPAVGAPDDGLVLTQFQVNVPPTVYKIKKNGKQTVVAAIEAKPCKGGVRRFDTEQTFAGGETLVATDISGCVP